MRVCACWHLFACMFALAGFLALACVYFCLFARACLHLPVCICLLACSFVFVFVYFAYFRLFASTLFICACSLSVFVYLRLFAACLLACVCLLVGICRLFLCAWVCNHSRNSCRRRHNRAAEHRAGSRALTSFKIPIGSR